MIRHIDTELQQMKERILEMGGLVELAVEEATSALILRESSRFQMVYDLEERINRLHCKVDEECLKMLARQSPLAQNLRLILAMLKINTDLERMGDQAVNISFNARDYLSEPPMTMLKEIPEMAARVRKMIRDSLDAFVRNDQELAQAVLLCDDEVDVLKNQTFELLREQMKQNPDLVDGALDLILVSRNLERLGDHATNIAEDVIFVTTGEDIRHGGGWKTTQNG